MQGAVWLLLLFGVVVVVEGLTQADVNPNSGNPFAIYHPKSNRFLGQWAMQPNGFPSVTWWNLTLRTDGSYQVSYIQYSNEGSCDMCWRLGGVNGGNVKCCDAITDYTLSPARKTYLRIEPTNGRWVLSNNLLGPLLSLWTIYTREQWVLDATNNARLSEVNDWTWELWELCAPGSVWDSSSHTCNRCPLHWYSPDRFTPCKSCLLSDKTSTPDNTGCTAPCSMGRYWKSAAEGCVPCPAGTYMPTEGTAPGACLPCPASTFMPYTGAIACTPCPFPYGSTGGQTQCSLPYSWSGVSVASGLYPNRADMFITSNTQKVTQIIKTFDGNTTAYTVNDNYLGAPTGLTVVGYPAALISQPGNVLSVAITASDNYVYRRIWTPSGGWSAWMKIGRYTTFSPALVSWGDYNLHLFIVSDDGGVYQKISSSPGSNDWSPSGETAWTGLGAPSGYKLITGVSVVSMIGGTLTLFGLGNNFQLFQRSYSTGGGWTSWVNHGGIITAPPSAVGGYSSGKLWWDVYVRNIGGTYSRKTYRDDVGVDAYTTTFAGGLQVAGAAGVSVDPVTGATFLYAKTTSNKLARWVAEGFVTGGGPPLCTWTQKCCGNDLYTWTN